MKNVDDRADEIGQTKFDALPERACRRRLASWLARRRKGCWR